MAAGEWPHDAASSGALELFDQMAEEGLERDHVSVNTAMAAAEAGGQTERLKQLTVGVGATGVSGVDAGGNSDGGEDDDGDVEREDGEREGGDGAGLIDGSRVGAVYASGGSNAAAEEEDTDDDDDEKGPDIEEDPVVRERRLKAERRDARKRKFD